MVSSFSDNGLTLRFILSIRKNLITRKILNLRTGYPERPWKLHPWRFQDSARQSCSWCDLDSATVLLQVRGWTSWLKDPFQPIFLWFHRNWNPACSLKHAYLWRNNKSFFFKTIEKRTSICITQQIVIKQVPFLEPLFIFFSYAKTKLLQQGESQDLTIPTGGKYLWEMEFRPYFSPLRFSTHLCSFVAVTSRGASFSLLCVRHLCS